jgi:YesN/AraC family two-component response regulator
MPNMSGIDFLHEARKEYGQKAAIVLSGYLDMEPLKQVFHDTKLTRFLAKPWVNDELLDTVADMIGQG